MSLSFFPKCHPLYDKINYWTEKVIFNQVLSSPLFLKNRYHFPSLSSAVPVYCVVGFAPSDCTLTGNCSLHGCISMATAFSHQLQHLPCVLQYLSAENTSARTVVNITPPLAWTIRSGCAEMDLHTIKISFRFFFFFFLNTSHDSTKINTWLSPGWKYRPPLLQYG